ncbi:MFS transporter [Brucella sp. NBRC 12950]|uniref:MFS transporter n=1 Tax=Brucella sp. NBRC 12950 TaxID=2994518 RepID=UPI0024A3CB62|nr:MFS transporter [Brucella sp. NBRC 12950]GLU30015.1 MFS transporter [Brucella sp. NBRC 12950]
MTPLSRLRLRCSLYFTGGGIGIGAWAASLPLISLHMGLDKGELGLILLFFAAGAIALMITTGRLLDRIADPTLLSFLGSILFGASIALASFVQSTFVLTVCVFMAGAGFGTLDVSMNTEASSVETVARRHLMSSFHALFSLGNLIGAVFVGLVVSYGGTVLHCLFGAGTLVCVACVTARGLSSTDIVLPRKDSVSAGLDSVSDSRDQRAILLLLGVVAFFAFLAEGGMMDWTSVYMVSHLAAPENIAAYGFAVFAAAMTCGRFLGDSVVTLVGHYRVLLLGSIFCAFAVLGILSASNTTTVLVSLAFCGLGLANMIPAVFASAGNAGGRSKGQAMATVTTMGYSGLLLGPAVLGFIAQASSLWVSFIVIMVAFIAVGVLSYIWHRYSAHLRACSKKG